MLAITTLSLRSGWKQFAQNFLARIYRSNVSLVICFIVLAVLVSLLTLYTQSHRELSFSGAEQVFKGRDFSETPFSLMDAYDACLMESRSKFGSSMLRSHMLPLSTRYDPEKQEYLVVLSADVGTVDDWNVATIYCSIDPVKEEVSYYKEVHDGKQSMLSKTMSMLSSMLK